MTARARRIALAVAIAAVAGAGLAARPYLRAASLLRRFADPDDRSALARVGAHDVDVEALPLTGPAGPIAARIYRPRGVPGAPGVVLLHGVHRLSIDEPRLVRFARAIAESGFVVLTPALAEIAGYRIEPASIATIVVAARALAADRGRPVGVVGMSFAGGLGLLAAADPDGGRAIGVVLSIGGHDDLGRVARFFAEDQAPEPEGPPLRLVAHPYGAMVVAHANADGLFPPADVDAARGALAERLAGHDDAAAARAAPLGPASRALLERLFAGAIGREPAEFLAAIDRLAPRMAAVSPRGRVAGLRARVFLLHGAADPVIPASEARWLLRELPPAARASLLVSSALGHVELAGVPTLRDQLSLVAFMKDVLEALEGA